MIRSRDVQVFGASPFLFGGFNMRADVPVRLSRSGLDPERFMLEPFFYGRTRLTLS